MKEQYTAEVYFDHVLFELSKNRKDPCEIIRELIANSYDAKASKIWIYPLLQYQGFIFVDNGIGISETEEINSITPYKAFFSIGKSTKIFGESIGYKCQGSKLCFASNKFTLITRCQAEKSWRSLSIDNPKSNLGKFNLASRREDDNPLETLNNLFPQADVRTVAILRNLEEVVFKTNRPDSGTMIIVQGVEVEDFAQWYGTEGPDFDYLSSMKVEGSEWSYIRNYIRFNTKHGDVRILRPKETGFSADQANNFKKSIGYNDRCELHLWTRQELKDIAAGYPYLSKPEAQDLPLIKSPSSVSRLSDGNFYYRAARSFEFNGYVYCIILAIDGNRRALEKYKELNRQGQKGKRSGIRLTDQRGTFICSQGIKICSYNELFEQNGLKKYQELGSPKGKLHYILMIDGNFELVTDRNSLSESALKILKNEQFIKQIEKFLDDYSRKTVLGELINRLSGEREEIDRDGYIELFESLKARVQYRTRFRIKGIPQLEGIWLLAPDEGEESWVGALYTLFSHLVPDDSTAAQLWLRPRTFSSSRGLDSIAVMLKENSLAAAVHKGLEYKYSFSHKEEFNHLLTVTDQIVCWVMTNPENNDQIQDSYNYYGYVSKTEELNEIGYKIVKVQSRTGDQHQGETTVINLRKLIEKTFVTEWETPPPPNEFSQRGRKSQRRNRI